MSRPRKTSYTVRQFARKRGKLIRRVMQGERITITRGKHPIADVVPVDGGVRVRFP